MPLQLQYVICNFLALPTAQLMLSVQSVVDVISTSSSSCLKWVSSGTLHQVINVHLPGLNITCSWKVRDSHSLQKKWILKHILFPEWYVQYYNISRGVCIETYTIETGCPVVRTHSLPPLHDCVPQWRGVANNRYPANTIHSPYAGLMLAHRQCWFTIYDPGPTLNQQWDNVSCLLGSMSLPRLFVSHMRVVNVLWV